MHQQKDYISDVQQLLKQNYGVSLADIGLVCGFDTLAAVKP